MFQAMLKDYASESNERVYLATEVSSRDIGLSDTGGAIPMAMDYIVQNQLLNDYTYEWVIITAVFHQVFFMTNLFRFFVNYTDCDESTAAGVAVQMLTEYRVDVIIGPPCTTCGFIRIW